MRVHEYVHECVIFHYVHLIVFVFENTKCAFSINLLLIYVRASHV